jgi:hypothetical protein
MTRLRARPRSGRPVVWHYLARFGVGDPGHGFNDPRVAYDDNRARCCVAVEHRTPDRAGVLNYGFFHSESSERVRRNLRSAAVAGHISVRKPASRASPATNRTFNPYPARMR